MIAETSDTMELPKRKRNPDDGELDVTPMIDVTFLLLAFFVVVSKMDPQASVPLPKASYGVAISDKECVTLIMAFGEFDGTSFVKTGKDEETKNLKPKIFLGAKMNQDSAVPEGDEDDQKEFIGDYVEKELTDFPLKKYVLIKAAGNCKTGAVELVKKGVSKSTLALDREIYVGIEEEQ